MSKKHLEPFYETFNRRPPHPSSIPLEPGSRDLPRINKTKLQGFIRYTSVDSQLQQQQRRLSAPFLGCQGSSPHATYAPNGSELELPSAPLGAGSQLPPHSGFAAKPLPSGRGAESLCRAQSSECISAAIPTSVHSPLPKFSLSDFRGHRFFPSCLLCTRDLCLFAGMVAEAPTTVNRASG